MKQTIPKAWHRAGRVLVPKEEESSNIRQFRPVSLLNIEGKVSFSFIAQKLTNHLVKNKLVDTTVQNTGIPGFSGGLEHTSMIWHQILSAKHEKRDVPVIFLYLANAFGSVPHSVLWAAFDFFKVPEPITNLIKAHIEELQFCFTTPDFTTIWQHLEMGIMAGCTISPLAFTMAMEVIIRASKLVVGGKRQKSGVQLTTLRAYMYEITPLPQKHHAPDEIRSVFYFKGEPIPTVSEKPIKSLGQCYDASLKDCEQVQQLKQDINSSLRNNDQSMLPGKGIFNI